MVLYADDSAMDHEEHNEFRKEMAEREERAQQYANLAIQKRLTDIAGENLGIAKRKEWIDFVALVFSALSLLISFGSLIIAGLAFWKS